MKMLAATKDRWGRLRVSLRGGGYAVVWGIRVPSRRVRRANRARERDELRREQRRGHA